MGAKPIVEKEKTMLTMEGKRMKNMTKGVKKTRIGKKKKIKGSESLSKAKKIEW